MESLRKILVVDEDRDFIDGCHRTFNGNSYRLHSVSNKQQAQQTINDGFDLIIIGSLTPAGESFMLQQWVKRHPMYRHIPVLVIDACFSERRWKGWRVFEGLQMDAEEYVSKPVEPVDLLPIIEKLCANIVNDEGQILETLWQAFLSLDKGDRDLFSRRVLQLKR
jgi:CheY-like chemotaxis protein